MIDPEEFERLARIKGEAHNKHVEAVRNHEAVMATLNGATRAVQEADADFARYVRLHEIASYSDETIDALR